MTTTTGPALRRRALDIIRMFGATEEQAESVLRRFTDAGIHLVEVEPPAVYTGEKAGDPHEHVEKLRAIVRSATKPVEYEEQG